MEEEEEKRVTGGIEERNGGETTFPETVNE